MTQRVEVLTFYISTYFFLTKTVKLHLLKRVYIEYDDFLTLMKDKDEYSYAYLPFATIPTLIPSKIATITNYNDQ